MIRQKRSWPESGHTEVGLCLSHKYNFCRRPMMGRWSDAGR